ncbi:RNA polymerase sigma-70 factor (ECF subfamily) [Flavobacterium sp. HSC-32F16]|uniref:RNA polymerase sigma-70 factor n=1 Tax=Flavobacterium sp. HSC-32F16 TaxID=2910964 RepID=UPI0020A2C40F|nr:RNA polymerase sigma-70 factor [Flavobacterium sp. HSC-32F16]MCP2025836.1 RNA polymerase sigma-70 factor (ECF subfamily) [Flavobacterium sp. HSC-32F16]
MNITDEELIQSIKAGSKEALTILYDRFCRQLLAFSYNLLKDRELCEEIVQDVFIDFWNRRYELQIKVSLQSYLYATVRYKIFAEFRKDKAIRVELYDDINSRMQYSTPETRMIHEELEEQVRLIIDNLPDKCQLVFNMSRNEELSHKEIAELLGISTRTVETHITNALKVLRDSLGHALTIEFILHLLR